MRTNLKRNLVIGSTGLAAVALTAGFALPANAAETENTTTDTTTGTVGAGTLVGPEGFSWAVSKMTRG